MPVGRPDFWYGQVLLFESAPTDGRTDAGPTSDWAHDHAADPAAHGAGYTDAQAVAAMGAKAEANPLHHDRYTDALALAQAQSVIDDTPDNADVTHAPSSNWAFDHKADAAAHHVAFVAADADALILTHKNIAAAHHAAFVAADADTKIATHTAIAAAHHAAFVAADAAALILTHKNIAAAHHAKTVSAEIDHGGVAGLADDDHSQYLHISTERSISTVLKFLTSNYQIKFEVPSYHKYTWMCDPANNRLFSFIDYTDWVERFTVDLLGNITLVGTVDGVSLSGGIFIDRGDPSAADWSTANFNTDGNWHDCDLSAVVPSGAKAVLIRAIVSRTAAGGSLAFRKNGNSNIINASYIMNPIAATAFYADMIVACDSNRVIEYAVGGGAGWAGYLTVAGWWK